METPKPSIIPRIKVLKQLWKMQSFRYGLFWVSAGFFIMLVGRRAVEAREKQLMFEELDEYLINKKKPET